MKALVTGGGGFVGSHATEYYAGRGWDVICYDNLSRGELLKKDVNTTYNWEYLSKYKNVTLKKADIRDYPALKEAAKDADLIIHAAAQTAVTTSVKEPRPDFEANAVGAFNVLEAARAAGTDPTVVYCSTNKVYGENVNTVRVTEEEKRYSFEEAYTQGIPESFSIDLCEHTPYGCSKLTGDLYAQDYARLYGLKAGVFRMSCIYGTLQFGVEDQGWVAWFTIATLTGKPITIYGDGKQVRDVLYVDDLIGLYERFRDSKVKHGVYNTGGGPENTMSLLELLDTLEELTGKRAPISYSDWRPSDQKVYVSDITKAGEELGWEPTTSPREGVGRLVSWVQENKGLF